MFKKKIIALSVATCFIALPSVAQNTPSWDNIEVSSVNVSTQKSLEKDVKVSGLAFMLTKTIDASDFFYKINLSHLDDVHEGSTLRKVTGELLLGYKVPFKESSDFFIAIGENSTANSWKNNRNSESQFLVKVGVRSMLSENLEFDGTVNHQRKSNISATGYSMGFYYLINQSLSIGVDYNSLETINTSKVKVRWSF